MVSASEFINCDYVEALMAGRLTCSSLSLTTLRVTARATAMSAWFRLWCYALGND